MHVQRPRWHSLVAKYSLTNLTDATLIGCDRFVRVFHLDPGLLVGLWKVRLGQLMGQRIPPSQPTSAHRGPDVRWAVLSDFP